MESKFRIELIVPGEPITKSNKYKIARRGKIAIMYIDKDVKKYEEYIAHLAMEKMQQTNLQATDQPVRMIATYYLGTKRRKDIQNLDKSLCDALNEIVYLDDSQVYELYCYKKFDKENPRTELVVEAL